MTTDPRSRPVDAGVVRGGAGPMWSAIEVIARTGSTNADLVARTATADCVGDVVIAEHQVDGRGRHGRVWSSPPGTQLAMSVAVDAGGSDAAAVLGWLPLLTGVAAVRAIATTTGISSGLKWPNDVMIDGHKVAGILAELAHGPRPAVVIGIGINTAFERDELPVPTATSLNLHCDRPVDRSVLVGAVLAELADGLSHWPQDVPVLAGAYRAVCVTIGARVRVELPGHREITGTARDVDPVGRIVIAVDGQAETMAVAAGDVTHLRIDAAP